jgi:sulfate transport system ATP-binding protein
MEIKPTVETAGSQRRGREFMSISVRDVTKNFGHFQALKNVDLEIPTGELVALLGPSGSGKTTLLRIIAGLEFADSGTVQFDGKDITDQSARERRVGFVFQHYALFRHLTVFENIAFGLRARPRRLRPSKAQIRAKVEELLGLIQLQNQAGRYPSQLSGGQRQRVALARALAVEPSVLLLDEPFGALDAKVRQELRRWLRQLHDEVHITSVFVTHDQEEALELADRVAVMNAGQIEQIGSPDEIYNHPASSFVYNFLGSVNLFHGRIDNGTTYIQQTASDHLVFVRPHSLEITRQPNGANHFRATTKHINAAGPLVKVEAVTEWGAPVHIEMSQERFRDLHLVKDEVVFIVPKEITVFETGEAGSPGRPAAIPLAKRSAV